MIPLTAKALPFYRTNPLLLELQTVATGSTISANPANAYASSAAMDHQKPTRVYGASDRELADSLHALFVSDQARRKR